MSGDLLAELRARSLHADDALAARAADEIEILRMTLATTRQENDVERVRMGTEINRARSLVGKHAVFECGCMCGADFDDGEPCARCSDWFEVTGPGGYLIPCPECVAPAFAAHVAAILGGGA